MKKQKEKIKGRAAAVIGMVLLIVLSIPLGMGFSLVRARNAASAHFYGSYDTLPENIWKRIMRKSQR